MSEARPVALSRRVWGPLALNHLLILVGALLVVVGWTRVDLAWELLGVAFVVAGIAIEVAVIAWSAGLILRRSSARSPEAATASTETGRGSFVLLCPCCALRAPPGPGGLCPRCYRPMVRPV